MSPVMDLLRLHRRRDGAPCSCPPRTTAPEGRNASDYVGQEKSPSPEKLGVRDGQPHFRESLLPPSKSLGTGITGKRLSVKAR